MTLQTLTQLMVDHLKQHPEDKHLRIFQRTEITSRELLALDIEFHSNDGYISIGRLVPFEIN